MTTRHDSTISTTEPLTTDRPIRMGRPVTITTTSRIPRRCRQAAAGRWVVAIATAALVATAGLAGVSAGTAAASTLGGVATVASPGTTTPLTSGASTDLFTVSLPAQAACDGDTATGGYHVYSYFIQKGTTLSTVTFIGHPSVGSGLFETNGKYYGPVNTAVTTGAVPNPLPNDLVFSELLTHGEPLLSLLYTGTGSSASGIWETGIACATSTGALADNWNAEVTFTASSSDPNGFTWTALAAGTSAPAFTSATTAAFTEGSAGTFKPAASGSPTPTITESGALPAGVSFTGGSLTGTPTATGTFPITFTANNGIGSPATQSFTLTVAAATAATTTTTSPGGTTPTTTTGGTTSTTATGSVTTSGTDSSGSGGTTGAPSDAASNGGSLPFTGLRTTNDLGLGLLGIGLGLMLLGWGYRRKIRPARLARKASS